MLDTRMGRLLMRTPILGMSQLTVPGITPASAPATQFSAERAFQELKVIAHEPHPMGSPAHAAVERYLVNQLAALGLHPQIWTTTASQTVQPGVIWAGQVHHIVARIAGMA
jgi:hypothetical protein